MIETIAVIWSLIFLHVYTAAGAIILWTKLGRRGREVWGLSNLVSTYVQSEQKRKLVEPLVFVTFGTFLAVGILAPRYRGSSGCCRIGVDKFSFEMRGEERK